MARESHRTPPTGSAFIRLLATMAEAPSPGLPDDFAQRLTQWFDWTHTLSLSTTLGDAAAVSTGTASPALGNPLERDEQEHARVRSSLARQITEAASGNPGARPRAVVAPLPPTLEEMLDVSSHRRRYVACQQAMDAQIGPLRRRVRATLSGLSPALNRLAALDGLMEQVVGAQERVLLSSVPAVLERRFERLRRAHEDRESAPRPPAAAAEQPGAPPRPAAPPWLDRFRHDMNALLLAELDLRLQPVEGLLDAGRAVCLESP